MLAVAVKLPSDWSHCMWNESGRFMLVNDAEVVVSPLTKGKNCQCDRYSAYLAEEGYMQFGGLGAPEIGRVFEALFRRWTSCGHRQTTAVEVLYVRM